MNLKDFKRKYPINFIEAFNIRIFGRLFCKIDKHNWEINNEIKKQYKTIEQTAYGTNIEYHKEFTLIMRCRNCGKEIELEESD